MKWRNPFKWISPAERATHIFIWGLGLILINIPDWTVTLGPFHSDDYTLIVPSLYGLPLNAYLFYGCARIVVLGKRRSIGKKIQVTLGVFVIVTLIESALDSIAYYAYFHVLNKDIVSEIIFGQMLMNFIFFYLPSLMYGFFKVILISENQPEDVEKLMIKDGHSEVYLNLKNLSHIEADGNYCTYHERTKYMIRQSLIEAQQALPNYFIRCHKSYVINTQRIEKRTYDEVVVGGFIVPIGRSYRENLK